MPYFQCSKCDEDSSKLTYYQCQDCRRTICHPCSVWPTKKDSGVLTNVGRAAFLQNRCPYCYDDSTGARGEMKQIYSPPSS